MNRKTYVEVNLKNIENNVKKLKKKYKGYSYYFGVVKADSYGHNGLESIKSIIKGGCNYLAVATLEEALTIRQEIKDIPILCLGIINPVDIPLCIKKKITITISSLTYLKELLKRDTNKLKVHIKLNTGMNRLGVKKEEDFLEMFNLIKKSNLFLEGLYTHIYFADSKETTENQIEKFESITRKIDLSKVPIIHLFASDATMQYKKLTYANGCRLGIAIYGLASNQKLKLKPTFSLYSQVIEIKEVEEETVGYNGSYKVGNKEYIAIIPIGYADGIIRKNTGRFVYIHEKSYQIVGNICMDMLFVKVDSSIKVGDKVTIIRDTEHIHAIAKHLDTIPYEVICSIGKRVPRIYK